jgi:hypothetical protein
VRFDAAFEGVPSIKDVQTYTAALRAITEFDPVLGVQYPGIRNETLEQYCKLGELMAPHERLGIGLYNGASDEPEEWKHVTAGEVADIRSELSREITVYGAVQGIIHAWFKESEPPFFQLRDAATSGLVKCFYSEALYPTLVGALEVRSTVVHVAGIGRYTRAGSMVELRAERLEAVRPLKDEEFEDCSASPRTSRVR